MVDLDPIPLADPERAGHVVPESGPTRIERMGWTQPTPREQEREPFVPVLLVCLLSGAHGLAIWWAMGGAAGLDNGWPLWRDDHPLYYHSALVTRSFLTRSATTAGYDPAFMAGYPKSVIFPASSTLPELVVWAFGGDEPERAYKLYVFGSAAAVPWLIALAAASWRLRPEGAVWAVLLFLVYLWTDFPINYAGFGMLPYLLAVPLALLATGLFATFLIRGGFFGWLCAVTLQSMAVLVHLTAAMILVPASALAYLVASLERGAGRRFPLGRHLGVWLIPVVVLAANVFWWLPGLWLAGTKGPSDFAFAHSSEHLGRRLLQIFTTEAQIECVLIALGVPGLVFLWRQSRVRGAAILGFCVAGFFWGYLAGGFPALDFLQPGRHTFAMYTGLAMAAGGGLDGFFLRLRGAAGGTSRLDRWAIAAALLIGWRLAGPSMLESLRLRVWSPEPFLSSQPSPRLQWVVEKLKTHVKRGERLIYEEGGKGLPGIPDPFQNGRFSGLIADRLGVELLGGPYLHASLRTNFTQFGEGALFGKVDWDRDDFVRYARLYRPSAILCWSPRARRFCRSNPDLVQIVAEDGVLVLGRVLGFEGDTIRGSAKVTAEPGRLRVSEMSAGVDGTVVLRYHSVPGLESRPPVPLEPRLEEGDPVPFIGLRPPPNTTEVVLEMASPYRFPGEQAGSSLAESRRDGARKD
jgi:hypothetical protein